MHILASHDDLRRAMRTLAKDAEARGMVILAIMYAKQSIIIARTAYRDA